MPNSAKLRGVTLDCADPKALVQFYHHFTGMEIAYSEDTFAGLTGTGGANLGFQWVQDYQAPQWPGQSAPQQFHLDFGVRDLAGAEAEALSLGATRPAFQPGEDRWRVLLDPAGHPFCLMAE